MRRPWGSRGTWRQLRGPADALPLMASSQGQGMLPMSRQPLMASCQGQGMLPGSTLPPISMLLKIGHGAKANAVSMGKQPRPRHAAEAKVASLCNKPRPFGRSVRALPTEPIHVNIMENDSYTLTHTNLHTHVLNWNHHYLINTPLIL